MERQWVTHPFEPVWNEQSEILILGSLPSVKSRENQFYYGHPQNRFWKLLAGIFGEPIPQSVEEKKRFILDHHLALYDVFEGAEIAGSSDASIRNPRPVNLASMLRGSNIHTVLCNGNTAGKAYKKYLEEDTGIQAITLPSTSPANAAWSLERLTEAWKPSIILPVQKPIKKEK